MTTSTEQKLREALHKVDGENWQEQVVQIFDSILAEKRKAIEKLRKDERIFKYPGHNHAIDEVLSILSE